MPKTTKKPQKQRAAIYLRVSTDEQVEAYGLDVQLEQCRTYAQAFSIPVWNVFTDDGISGAKAVDKRPALSALLDAAKRGEFNQLIVPAIDRLARNLRLFLQIWDELEAAGIKIILVKERLETDSASGLLMRNILAVFADYERELIKERTTGGRRARAKVDGERGGSLPMGYRRVASGQFDIEPLAAGLVRHIFALRKDGNTFATIADKLNSQGFTTQRGKQWHGTSVREIILNEPKYRGSVNINGSEKYWPVILAA
jgi:site-specific DNA recombinase